ncbi:MAG: alpha/beta hydrolase [Gemmatimonadetes bacterium]|nr:MAG: alpha/beta hydrolase [Gemmatimonadota bacterium]
MRLALTPLLAIALSSSAALPSRAQTPRANPRTSGFPKSGFVRVNGLDMYYELHGAGGTPLVLIHGGGSTIGTNFSRVLPLLSRNRRVIAVEVQAHGHTRDIDRPFTFEQDADDIAALLDSLHVPHADILGFSNGGTTALQIAIRHPAKVNRLVIASSNYKRDGMAAGFWDFMEKGTYADMPKPYEDAYLKINPSQAGVHAMQDRDAKRMLGFKDIPDASIRGIQAPTLVVVGDRDVIRPEHALELSRTLPHARLCILPGTHGSYLGEIMTPKVSDRTVAIFADLVLDFLDGRE